MEFRLSEELQFSPFAVLASVLLFGSAAKLDETGMEWEWE
jgi:hypothetical protein